MKFDRVLSFGRTGEELLQMFSLSPSELSGLRVLDCPSGPGSLCSFLRRYGVSTTAVDPGYSLSPECLENQTLNDIQTVAEQIER
ncbi:MAG: hypothetical protein VKI81_12075, partial [Synechococcaceae cyanobacterium]|nr:hypothetical protein [Synechococcaceae cyanobacterium]